MLLMVLVQRHWTLHGPRLMPLLEDLGSLASSVRAQAEAMEREQDGVRKAVMMHGLLRAMVNMKLDLTVTQLSPKSLAAVSEIIL